MEELNKENSIIRDVKEYLESKNINIVVTNDKNEIKRMKNFFFIGEGYEKINVASLILKK